MTTVNWRPKDWADTLSRIQQGYEVILPTSKKWIIADIAEASATAILQAYLLSDEFGSVGRR